MKGRRLQRQAASRQDDQAAPRRVVVPEKTPTPEDELAVLNAAIARAKAAYKIYSTFSQEQVRPRSRRALAELATASLQRRLVSVQLVQQI